MELTVSYILNEQLKSLNLDRFPCGFGKWREDYHEINTKLGLSKNPIYKRTLKSNISNHFSVTLKDSDANCEKTDVLAEYVLSKHSPWTIDYEFSSNAKELREMAIKTPWSITPKFIQEHFKTVKIIDKRITQIDDEVKKLKNLEELILCANDIQTVVSQNLPKSLKVLELYSNRIDSLKDLIKYKICLQHLGLGLNQISSLEDCINGFYWPELISLDLSANHLCNILEVVSCLETLPKLRCLILQGNPLALVPGYRGYVIDSLKNLQILDDTRLSADDKHMFKGLSRKKENVSNEIKLVLEVKSIKNLPIPDEIKSPDDYPEFPIISRKYMIQFWLPINSATNEESSPTLTASDEMSTVDILKPTESQDNINNINNDLASIKESKPVETRVNKDGVVLVAECSHLVPYSAEEIEVNWQKQITRDELRVVRDFFQHGCPIEIVEEKSLLYPPDELPNDAAKESIPAGKKDKPSVAPKKDDVKDKKKEEPGAKGGGKKKKKFEESQLVVYSVENTVLEMFHLSLEAFLEGACLIEDTLMSAEAKAAAILAAEALASAGLDTGAANNQTSSTTDGKKGKVGGKDDKKTPKGRTAKISVVAKGKGKSEENVNEEEDVVPVSLQVGVAVKLIQWRNVADSIEPAEIVNMLTSAAPTMTTD